MATQFEEPKNVVFNMICGLTKNLGICVATYSLHFLTAETYGNRPIG